MTRVREGAYIRVVISVPMKPCPLYSLTVFLAGILCQPALRGQAPITAFSASYIAASSAVNNYIAQPALSSGAFNGCSSTSYLYTFSNGVSNQYRLNNFIANGNTFFIAPASAATIKLRRVNNANASGNRSIVYMESTSASLERELSRKGSVVGPDGAL